MLYSNHKTTKSELYKPLMGVYASIKGGIVGFGIIAILIILTKLLSFTVNSTKSISFNLNDFILSFWGFLILSFIVFAVENKKGE